MDKVCELWEQVCLSAFSRTYLKWDISRLCKVQMSSKNRNKLLNLNNDYLRTLHVDNKSYVLDMVNLMLCL